MRYRSEVVTDVFEGVGLDLVKRHHGMERRKMEVDEWELVASAVSGAGDSFFALVRFTYHLEALRGETSPWWGRAAGGWGVEGRRQGCTHACIRGGRCQLEKAQFFCSSGMQSRLATWCVSANPQRSEGFKIFEFDVMLDDTKRVITTIRVRSQLAPEDVGAFSTVGSAG